MRRRAAATVLPIVGIGGSAGGLEAVTQVLDLLPQETGMAFVLVQHLDPTHESALASLLSRATAMPVSEARNNAPLEPNHFYVIPPNKTIKQNVRTRQMGVRLSHDGHPVEVAIEVIPCSVPPAAEKSYLVVFEGLAPSAPVVEQNKFNHRGRAAKEETERVRLRAELAATRDSMQAIIEDQEATTEELRSANEEIMSSNEELQSTNEELETAKEEMQSSNEELNILNDELECRNAELEHVNNDLQNVLALVDIDLMKAGAEEIIRSRALADALINGVPRPTLVLDNDVNVQAANQAFYRAFQVSAEETLNHRIYMPGSGQWDIPKLRTLLEEILPRNSSFQNSAVEHSFPHIGRKKMRLDARRLRSKSGRHELVLLGIDDLADKSAK